MLSLVVHLSESTWVLHHPQQLHYALSPRPRTFQLQLYVHTAAQVVILHGADLLMSFHDASLDNFEF